MRTLQPITPLEAVILIAGHTAKSRTSDSGPLGYDWQEWTVEAHGEIGVIVQLTMGGEDLGYYTLR